MGSSDQYVWLRFGSVTDTIRFDISIFQGEYDAALGIYDTQVKSILQFHRPVFVKYSIYSIK